MELAGQVPSLVKRTLEVFRFAEEHGVTGACVFDYVLAITARENGVEGIYTRNVDDFEMFGFLVVEDPL